MDTEKWLRNYVEGAYSGVITFRFDSVLEYLKSSLMLE